MRFEAGVAACLSCLLIAAVTQTIAAPLLSTDITVVSFDICQDAPSRSALIQEVVHVLATSFHATLPKYQLLKPYRTSVMSIKAGIYADPCHSTAHGRDANQFQLLEPK